jgi:hypothetical protein
MTRPDAEPGGRETVGQSPRARRVRPYAITRGRTRSRTVLALETLVEWAHGREQRSLSREQQAIRDVCLRPMSVAEVSARTALPLGVVRVLLDDLAAADLVVVHTTAGDRPDRALLERVLDGLQRL